MAQPQAVARLPLSDLTGDWFEIAGTGSWARRRCLADTRFRFTVRRDPGSLNVSTVCTTGSGVERKRGRLTGDRAGSGALRLRLVPGVFGVLPAVWSDFWVLAVGNDVSWLLAGERRHRAASILSRTVTLDEASVALALAVARGMGYDVGRIVRVPHPSGATGLVP